MHNLVGVCVGLPQSMEVNAISSRGWLHRSMFVSASVCVGANVGVHYAPSVMPQSEIRLVANNSKTREMTQGRRNRKAEL